MRCRSSLYGGVCDGLEPPRSDRAESEQDPALVYFFFQAEDGIRDLVRSRGLGDVYKRQVLANRYEMRIPVSFFLVEFSLSL